MPWPTTHTKAYTSVSSGVSIVPNLSKFPKHIIQEYTEYENLLRVYKKRFEQFPDSEMRETLFKQAIKIVSENLE